MKWTPRDISQWHRHFPLWPVMVGNKAYWLETVERRGELIGYCLGDCVIRWEYRAVVPDLRAERNLEPPAK